MDHVKEKHKVFNWALHNTLFISKRGLFCQVLQAAIHTIADRTPRELLSWAFRHRAVSLLVLLKGL